MIEAVTRRLLRRSASIDVSREQSREMQEASVRRMSAAFDGCAPDLFVDWGISGARQDRPEYQRLRTAVAEGRVTTVYAYSLSRLGRNATELLAFFELCRDNGTKVVTEAEGALSAESAMGKFLLTIMAAIAELERNQAAERSASARAVRAERGDYIGHAPLGYKLDRVGPKNQIVSVVDPEATEHLQAVRQAYIDTGSNARQTCVKLWERGIKTPRGKDHWSTAQLIRVITRQWPELLPPARRVSGRRRLPASILSGLLRCHCGTTLTANVGSHDGYNGGYVCAGGKGRLGSERHGKTYISQKKILPLVRTAVADRRDTFSTIIVLSEQGNERREALVAKKEAVVEAFIDGDINRDQKRRKLAEIDARIEEIDDEQRVRDLAGDRRFIDWAGDPATVNFGLQALLKGIQLGPDMLPVSYDWRVDAPA